MNALRRSGRADPAEFRRAVRVLTQAGYPHVEAQREFLRYRTQVRAAISSARSLALAGLISGAGVALAVVLVFAGAAAALLAVQTAAGGSGSSPAIQSQTPTPVATSTPSITRPTVRPGAAASGPLNSGLRLPTPTPSPSTDRAGQRTSLAGVLAFLPIAGLLAPVLGSAGVGIALVEGGRRRREHAQRTFLNRAVDRQYLLHQVVVWVAVMAVAAGLVFVTAGSRTGGAFIGLMIVIGLPVSLVFRYYFYRTFPAVLARVSGAPADALARQVIEASFQIDPEDRAALAPVAGAPASRPRTIHTRGPAWIGGRSISVPDLAVFLGGFAGWWGLARWWVWWSGDSLAPFSGSLTPDIVGIFGGAALGALLVRFYRRYIE